VIGLLIVLPVAIGLMCFVSMIDLIVRWRSEAQMVCRDLLLQGQSHSAAALRSLLRLNPKAEQLRLARIQASQAVRLAPDPATKAAARAVLAKIQLQQTNLAFEQHAYIMRGEQAASSAALKAQHALRSLDLSAMSKNRPRFLTVKRHPDEIASAHDIPPTFSLLQSTSLSWKGHLKDRLASTAPVALRRLAVNLKVGGVCEATVVRVNQQWVSRAS
jgi:hypothetical protein